MKVDSYIYRNTTSEVLVKRLDLSRKRELISIVMENTGVKRNE